MSIEKMSLNENQTQKTEQQIAEELAKKQAELQEKEPDFIKTSSKPFDAETEGGELLEWGRENVKNIKQDIDSLTKQQEDIEHSKKIAELRELIHSYEEGIKAIERGEKYQVVLNKNNFDMRYDSVDKLHEQINKTEEELRVLENKKDIFEIKKPIPIEIPKEGYIEMLVEVPKQEQELVDLKQEEKPKDELGLALIELENARIRMAELETQFNAKKAEKSKGFWGKVYGIFNSKEKDISPEFVNAKAAWNRANDKYLEILKNSK